MNYGCVLQSFESSSVVRTKFKWKTVVLRESFSCWLDIINLNHQPLMGGYLFSLVGYAFVETPVQSWVVISNLEHLAALGSMASILKAKLLSFGSSIFSSVSDHVSLIYCRPSSTRYSTTKSQSFQSQDTLRGSVSRSKTEGFISSSGKNRQHIEDKRRCKTPASARAYTPIGESLEHNTRCYN